MDLLFELKKKPRMDLRLGALVGGGLIIAFFAYLADRTPARGVDAGKSALDVATPDHKLPGFTGLQESSSGQRVDEEHSRATQLEQMADGEAKTILKNAERLTRSNQYEEAIRLLHQARPILQDNALAYFELGRALMARKDYAAARDFYAAAIEKNLAFADAYFSFAEASEALKDLEAALGGMRSFIHVTADADPYRLKVAQARSAIWEWEAQLGRGPWGPTRGIPPGFTAEEIKRDGKGVGIKMQRNDTLREDGMMDAEVKAQTRFEIYKRK